MGQVLTDQRGDDPRQLLAAAPRTEPIRLPGGRRVAVTLLTGFLGAGKTTLLNRILTGDHGLRVGVLVNDFGAINIDASLVESVEENTISLVNGCVCCEVRDDLVTSLETMLARAEQIDYVILEASGVADPGGIVMTFLDWKYRQALRLDSITCVVDAEAIFRDADDEHLTGLKLRQIAFADLVLLNKTDLVTPDHLEVVHEWIDAHIERIRVVETTHGEAPLEVLLGVGRFSAHDLPPETTVPQHASEQFQHWSCTTDQLFDRERLDEMVRRELPGAVYRCKGLVYTTTDPDQPYALQVVGRRCELTPRPAASTSPDRTSQIVAIGRCMNTAELDQLFAICQTPTPGNARRRIPWRSSTETSGRP
jgi:G3E family GTPase